MGAKCLYNENDLSFYEKLNINQQLLWNSYVDQEIIKHDNNNYPTEHVYLYSYWAPPIKFEEWCVKQGFYDVRNLKEYPIETQELYDFLDEIRKGLNQDLIGDMRPSYIREIQDRIWRLEGLYK